MRSGTGTCVLLCAAWLVGACAEESGGSVVTRDPIPLESLRGELAATVCRMYESCPSIGDDDNSTWRRLASDVDACIAYFAPEREDHDLTRMATAAVDAGLARYDGAAMRRCLDQVEASCGRTAFVAGCVDVAFDGLVPLGGACESDGECAGDAFCALGETCGVCEASLPMGAACDFEGCSQADGPSACVDHVCVRHTTRVVALGDPCAWNEVPDDEPQPVCPTGSACVQANEESVLSTCRAYVPVGGACGRGEVCADLAACIIDTDGVGTCRAVVMQDAVGAPCDATHTCSPMARLGCVDGHCAAIGDGGAGTACVASDYMPWPSPCLVGFTCDAETRTCQPAAPHECTDDEGCSEGERCLAGRCRGAGPPCTEP